MRVSWLLLTYNRADMVRRALQYNMKNAGAQWDELVWVDNGSTDGIHDLVGEFHPSIFIGNAANQGVAKGYNAAMRAATGDLLVITGCDMLMPGDWLKTFIDYHEAIPDTGVACIYSHNPKKVPERLYGDPMPYNGKMIQPALPVDRRAFTRELLDTVGYFREDFGLYGWEDIEWAHRAQRVCAEHMWLTYMIPGMKARHLGTEGILPYTKGDDPDYHQMKQREATDPRKRELLDWCRTNNYPYYNPYEPT